MMADEFDIVRRALVLRGRRLIGVLWAEGGVFWISESEYDPHGSRLRITLVALKELVERLEEAAEAPLLRMPPGREEGGIPVALEMVG